MKKIKIIILFLVIFTCGILIAVNTTYRNSTRIYRVRSAISRTMSLYKLEVTSLHVEAENKKTSMFDTSIAIYVNINAEITQKAKGDKPYIGDIQVSEKVVQKDDEAPYALIEITPIIETDDSERTLYKNQPAEFQFKYKLNSFDGFGENKYVIKCGDKEETVIINIEK